MTMLFGAVEIWRRPAIVLLLAVGAPALLGVLIPVATAALSQPLVVLMIAVLLGGMAAFLLFLIGRLAPGLIGGWTMLAAVAWGALPAVLLSGIANEPWSTTLAGMVVGTASEEWISHLSAGPVEEPLKLLGVGLIGVAWPGAIHGARRGLVVGMLVGLGFGIVEDALYLLPLAVLPVGAGESLEAVAWVFGLRVVGGAYTHVALAGMAGAVLGWAVSRASLRRWVAAIGAVAAVATIHAVANTGLLAPPDAPWDGGDLPAVVATGIARAVPLLLVVGALLVLRQRARDQSPVSEQGLSSLNFS